MGYASFLEDIVARLERDLAALRDTPSEEIEPKAQPSVQADQEIKDTASSMLLHVRSLLREVRRQPVDAAHENVVLRVTIANLKEQLAREQRGKRAAVRRAIVLERDLAAASHRIKAQSQQLERLKRVLVGKRSTGRINLTTPPPAKRGRKGFSP